MYLASEHSKYDNLKFYYELVNRLIEKQDSTHEELFKRILISAHLLVIGKLTYYDIDRNIYDVVSELVKSEINRDYFKNNIHEDKITEEDFITLRNTLSSLSESPYL